MEEADELISLCDCGRFDETQDEKWGVPELIGGSPRPPPSKAPYTALIRLD